MAPRNHSRFWRSVRIGFRRVRIAGWLMILCLICAGYYLNEIGLPDFVKAPLLDRLRERGLNLHFTRMRWRWYRGIIAENVSFGRADGNGLAPRLTLKEMELRLNHRALLHGQLQVDSLLLRQGRLAWPVSAPPEPPRELALENIQTELRLLPDDVWQLEPFRAWFAGANIQFRGTITNATAIRAWPIFRARKPAAPGAWPERLRRFADTLARIHYTASPQLRIEVAGDARHVPGFIARVDLRAADANTPWGQFQNGTLALALAPTGSNEVVRAELNLQAATAQTPWAAATNLTLTLRGEADEFDADQVQAELHLAAVSPTTRWGRAAEAQLDARWLHSFTNALPSAGRFELQVAEAASPWGSARKLRVRANFSPTTNAAAAQGEATWAGWARLAPFALEFAVQARQLQIPELAVGEISCAGQWQAPELRVSKLAARLYDGGLDAEAGLNVATRELRFHGASDFDLQQIAGLLTEKSRHWLEQFSWAKPPRLQADGSVVLPAWTNHQPDWRGEVQPTVRLSGEFHVGTGAFRGVPAEGADSHFSYSNRFWRLPDLVVTRPEGRIELAHETDEFTHDYYFRIHSTVDVRAFRSLLATNQQRGFDLVGFSRPPEIDGEMRGRWYEPERITTQARVALTNFTFRGEPIGSLQTTLAYADGHLRCIAPRAELGPQHARADGLDLDFAKQIIYLTNGVGSADPAAVTRMIGPKVARAIAPYRFAQPPFIRAAGVIPLRDERLADLHFDVDGQAFQWWRLRAAHIAGHIDWVGLRLELHGVRADCYGGRAAGDAAFDFHPDHDGSDFQFNVAVTNADLHALMSDLTTNQSRLEGGLTGSVVVTNGDSTDLQRLRGGGQVSLHDGLVWEIPIFGILSPVLDGITPGLGSSRANEAAATFSLANGAMRSDDLEIRASAMRLEYRGAVDLKGGVNARAQAELLRDTWVLGPMLSTALWPVSKLFEYKITGTLHAPKSEPVFIIPKLLLLPFHPLRTLKELVPETPPSTQTNQPSILP